MSTATSETGRYDSFAASLQDTTAPPISTPMNLPLGVTDLTLSLKGGAPFKNNKISLRDETPLLLTVKFTNRPEGVSEMVMKVIISQLSKDSYRRGKSGSFSKYVHSTTFEKTVPIVRETVGHSITIEISHAHAPSSGFHGGDGPYDMFMSFTPAGTDGHDETITGGHEEALTAGRARALTADRARATSDAAGHDEEDDEYSSQIDETLRYTFYNPENINFLACLYYAVWRFWDGFVLARLYYGVWRLWERL